MLSRRECTNYILTIKSLSYLGSIGPNPNFRAKKKIDIITLPFTPVLRTSIKQGHFTQLSDAPFPCPLERLRAPLGAIIKLNLELHRSVHTRSVYTAHVR